MKVELQVHTQKEHKCYKPLLKIKNNSINQVQESKVY
jgi:hypothetical protein